MIVDGFMVAALLLSGAPWAYAIMLAVGRSSPGIVLVGLLAWVTLARSRPSGPSPDLVFCQSVADALRAGTSLRLSLADAADHTGRSRMARLCRSGRPFDELASYIETNLDVAGLAVGAAIRSAGSSGGRSAEVFDAIALSVGQEDEFLGEVRSATAHVRASAALIIAVALGIVVFGAANGWMIAPSRGGWLVVIGLSLLGTGSAWIAWSIRRTELT